MSEPPLTTPSPTAPPPGAAATAPAAPLPTPATPVVSAPGKKPRSKWTIIVIALAVIAVLLLVFGRHGHNAAESTEPVVSVAKVEREDLTEDLWLSAEFHPFQEV